MWNTKYVSRYKTNTVKIRSKVYKVTNVFCNVIRSKICSDAKNTIRGNIRTAYVKYGNSRKSKYIKTPYSNIRSMYLEQGKRYRLHRCEMYVYTDRF